MFVLPAVSFLRKSTFSLLHVVRKKLRCMFFPNVLLSPI